MSGAFVASVISLVQHGRVSSASTLESVIHDHHIYKQIWLPLVGEILTLQQEESNNNDKFTVNLLKDATVVSHVPQESSWVQVLSVVVVSSVSLVQLLPCTSSAILFFLRTT